MNHIFTLALQFLLKRQDIPCGINLLPLVVFLLDEAGSHGYFEMREKVSSVLACEGFSTDSPFGEISLQTLSERWIRFLNEAVDEAERPLLIADGVKTFIGDMPLPKGAGGLSL